MELEELWNDSASRESRTMRHEAGHVATAWLIHGGTVPPFDYIEIGTMEEHTGGVVPGGVRYDIDWFDGLSPLERGAILLAGLFVQDSKEHDAVTWRELLDGLESAEMDDYARAMNAAEDASMDSETFAEQVRQHLLSFQPRLGMLVAEIAATLHSGTRTTAETIVSSLDAALLPNEERAS